MRYHPLVFTCYLFLPFSGNAQDKTQEPFHVKQNYSVQVSDDPAVKTKDYLIIDPKEEKTDASLENVRVIVRLQNEPLSTGRTKASAMTREHRKFLKDCYAIGEELSSITSTSKVTVLHEYKQTYNGFALSAHRHVVAQIEKLPYVASVTEDKQVKVFSTPGNDIIKAPEVWREFGVTGKNVRIGILDTGVDYTHPDLGGGFGENYKVAGGYDFVNNDGDPMDDNGHGTHVAGIAAANGVTLRGVAPNALIYAYKVLGRDGYGHDSGILAAIETVVNPDGNPETDDALDVVNMSLGRPVDPGEPLSTAVNNAVEKGVIFVIAAGNYSGNFSVATPGIARDAITVAATDQYNYTAGFSSRGPLEKTFESKPDVSAPGVDILSCSLNQQYKTESGTSMATPHVAGAAALLLEKNPYWTPAMVKSALMGTSRTTATSVWEQGAGLIDIFEAVKTSFVMEPGVISLGRTTFFQETTMITRILTIHNTSSETKTFVMTTEGPGAAGIHIDIAPSSFSVSARGKQEIVVTFAITASLLDVMNVPDAYTGSIIATNEGTPVKTIFSIVNPQVTRLNFDGELPQNVIVLGIEGSYFWKAYAPAGDTLDLYLPKASYDIISYYRQNHAVIAEGVSTEINRSISLNKSMAKNQIVFRPIDKDGNAIAFDERISGAVLFSGRDRNIFTFYPYAEDTFHISDQHRYRYDLEIHGPVPVTNEYYYNISLSTGYGSYESKTFSNDPDFTNINILNPGVPEGEGQQMTHYVSAGNQWVYFSTWNNSPFSAANPLKILHSQNDPESSMLGSLVQFRPAPERSGYRWETARWNVLKNDSIVFYKSPRIPLTSHTSSTFHYILGASLLRYNLYTNNTESKIVLTDLPVNGAFNRFYGERERGNVYYQLLTGEVVLKSGNFPNRISDDNETPLEIDASPAVYRLILTYEDYQVGGTFGKAHVTLDFNTSKADKNPPGISHLSLERDGLSTNELPTGQKGIFRILLNDLCQNTDQYSWCYSSGIRSTTLKIRKTRAEWMDLDLASTGTDEISAEVPANLDSGYYDLQLIAADHEGNELLYELIPAFLIGKSPDRTQYAVVTLIEPRNRDINAGRSPHFSWSSLTGATGYTIQLSSTADFTDLIIDEYVESTTYSLSEPLEDESTYYWRVKAIVGDTSIPWSEVYTFSSGVLEFATLLIPADSAVDLPLDVSFKWQIPANASWQTFELSTAEDFSSVTHYTGLMTDSLTVHNLLPGTDYYWRVGSTFFTFYDTYNVLSPPFHFRTFELPTPVAENETGLRLRYYPNPFSSKINISFTSRKSGVSRLLVKDALGKVVKVIDIKLQAGENTVVWDGSNNEGSRLPDGIYFASLSLDEYKTTHFRIVLKKPV